MLNYNKIYLFKDKNNLNNKVGKSKNIYVINGGSFYIFNEDKKGFEELKDKPFTVQITTNDKIATMEKTKDTLYIDEDFIGYTQDGVFGQVITEEIASILYRNIKYCSFGRCPYPINHKRPYKLNCSNIMYIVGDKGNITLKYSDIVSKFKLANGQGFETVYGSFLEAEDDESSITPPKPPDKPTDPVKPPVIDDGAKEQLTKLEAKINEIQGNLSTLQGDFMYNKTNDEQQGEKISKLDEDVHSQYHMNIKALNKITEKDGKILYNGLPIATTEEGGNDNPLTDVIMQDGYIQLIYKDAKNIRFNLQKDKDGKIVKITNSDTKEEININKNIVS